MSKALREFQAALVKTADYAPEAEEFRNLMREEWAHVDYNEDRQRGSVRAGSLGVVEFHQSGNDPAVVARIREFPLMKGSAESVAKALEAIDKILDQVG